MLDPRGVEDDEVQVEEQRIAISDKVKFAQVPAQVDGQNKTVSFQ